jgi:hypothetical protein
MFQMDITVYLSYVIITLLPDVNVVCSMFQKKGALAAVINWVNIVSGSDSIIDVMRWYIRTMKNILLRSQLSCNFSTVRNIVIQKTCLITSFSLKFADKFDMKTVSFLHHCWTANYNFLICFVKFFHHTMTTDHNKWLYSISQSKLISYA